MHRHPSPPGKILYETLSLFHSHVTRRNGVFSTCDLSIRNRGRRGWRGATTKGDRDRGCVLLNKHGVNSDGRQGRGAGDSIGLVF